MRYDWLVTAILTVHFAYLAYVVLGGFLAWRWPRAFFVHLLAAVWGILIVLDWVDCPLTWAEHWARQRNGEAPSNAGFIDRYVTNVLYPQEYLLQARSLAAGVVLVSWIGVFILWRRRRARARAAQAVRSDDARGERREREERASGARVTAATADTQVGDTAPSGSTATV